MLKATRKLKLGWIVILCGIYIRKGRRNSLLGLLGLLGLLSWLG
jgi:hypothetical protein